MPCVGMDLSESVRARGQRGNDMCVKIKSELSPSTLIHTRAIHTSTRPQPKRNLNLAPPFSPGHPHPRSHVQVLTARPLPGSSPSPAALGFPTLRRTHVHDA